MHGTETIPTGSNLEEVRAATLCLINRERELHGEDPLKKTPGCSPPRRGASEHDRP